MLLMTIEATLCRGDFFESISVLGIGTKVDSFISAINDHYTFAVLVQKRVGACKTSSVVNN